MATNLERRIINLEKAIPTKTVDFNASFENLGPPISRDNPRLRKGVEEFVEFLPGNGKHEKRGRAYLNPWCIIKFWGGGNRKSWNMALALLRQDPDFNGETHGLMGSVSFSEKDGEVVRSGGLLIQLGKFNRPGWHKDKNPGETPPGGFNFNVGDHNEENQNNSRAVAVADRLKR